MEEARIKRGKFGNVARRRRTKLLPEGPFLMKECYASFPMMTKLDITGLSFPGFLRPLTSLPGNSAGTEACKLDIFLGPPSDRHLKNNRHLRCVHKDFRNYTR